MSIYNYFIDAHCHLHEPWFDTFQVSKIADEAKNAKVEKIVNCASDPKMFDFIIDTYKKGSIYTTLGLQPTLAKEITEASTIQQYLDNTNFRPKINAIGEVGLDYYWVKDITIQKKQETLFQSSIMLANEYNLPLVIHSRKAEKETLDILNKYAQTPVLLHSFEGNLELIKRALDSGYFISIPSNVVIRKSRRKIAKRTGLDNMLLETDSPYCAPQEDMFPNTPSSIAVAANRISAILDTEISDVMHKTTKNSSEFYKLI